MYYIERKSKILELLQEERSVSVDSLAMAFDVSKETIRRDLRQMESEGLLTRTHGGAVPLTTAFTVPAPSPAEPPVDIRSTFNNDIKHSLCRKILKRGIMYISTTAQLPFIWLNISRKIYRLHLLRIRFLF